MMRLIDADALPYENMEISATSEEWCVRLSDIDSAPTVDVETISDGYHTFADLYEQRLILSAALAKDNPFAWKSKYHEDGTEPFGGGWFIVGFDTAEGSYTYHYELKDWNLFKCQELPTGKHWDGHTSKDVRRLLSLPTVDAEPVIRCKDCKHFVENVFEEFNNIPIIVAHEGCFFNDGNPIKVSAEHFCSWGERIQDENN